MLDEIGADSEGPRGFKKTVEAMAERFPPSDPTDGLYYYFFLCKALRLDADLVLIPEPLAAKTLSALNQFNAAQAHSEHDRLLLRYELKFAEASQARARGQKWQAETGLKELRELGARLGRVATFEAAVATVRFFLGASRAFDARSILGDLLTLPELDLAERLAATALLVEARRLGGDLVGADAVINETIAAFGETSDRAVAASLHELQWQALMLEVQKSGALGPLVRSVEPKAIWRSFDHCFVVWLAAIRTRNKLFLARLPPEAGFERMLGNPKLRSGLVAMEILREMTAAGCGERPATAATSTEELVSLVRALDLTERLPFGDLFILARECIAQRLADRHADFGASIAMEVWSDLLRRSGREGAADQLFEPLARMEQREGLRLGADDFSTVKRLGQLAKLVSGTTATLVASRLKQRLAHERDRQAIRDREFEYHARRLKKHIPSLKGAVRKLGQLYGIGNAVVPAPIRKVLEEAEATPSYMNFELVKSEVERTLRRSLTDVFAEFSETPVKVASMSQVHRAVLKDGSEVAVKVQYPGLERQMIFNFRASARLEPLFKPLAPQFDYRLMLNDLKEIMLRELRFEEEARNLERMHTIFSCHPHIKVPRIYPDLCRSNVLTMEYVWGTTLAEFAAIATPSQQADIGRLLVESVYVPLFRSEVVNSDPHPGNFLVDGSTLWVFDFGAVLPMDREVLLNMLRIAEAARLNNKASLISAMKNAGFLRDFAHDEAQTLMEFMRLIIGPLMDATSIFRSANIAKSVGLMQVLLPHLTLPSSSLPFLRMMIGLTNALTYVEAGEIRQYDFQKPLEDEFLDKLGLTRRQLLASDHTPEKDPV